MNNKLIVFASAGTALICLLSAIALSSTTLGVAALCSLFIGFIVWKLWAPDSDEDDDSSKMVSIVGLFSQLPYLDEEVLTDITSNAWDIEFETGNDATTFVAGNPPLFVIKTADRMYSINYFDRPYFENVDEVAEEVTDIRTKNVLESHNCWLSIDLLTETQPEDLAHEYALIGTLLNQMTDENCLGILVPQLMHLVPWDKNAEAALTSLDPIAALSPANPPVVPMDDDDPKLVAAAVEARKSWPRFVTAFEKHMRDENRDEGRNFSAKAPISANGNTEFIWVTVTSIENDIVYGKLGNEPVSLEGMREGDWVRFPANELDDWVYTDGSDVVGGFTIKVISEWANRFKTRN